MLKEIKPTRESGVSSLNREVSRASEKGVLNKDLQEDESTAHTTESGPEQSTGRGQRIVGEAKLFLCPLRCPAGPEN